MQGERLSVIEFEGFDEVTRKLDDLVEKASSIDGTQNVPLSELLTPEFLAKHTHFASEDQLFEASGFKVETAEDFERIPDDEWDAFISESTPFSTWTEMLSTAATEWTKKKLGLTVD